MTAQQRTCNAVASHRACYQTMLMEYVARGGEAGLRQAYEAGRAALASGLGVLEIAAIHHDALSTVLRQDADGLPPLDQRLQRANEFFAESLSSYEMTHRGFQEAVAALRRVNETLEQEIHRLAHTVHDDAGQLLVVARLALAGLASDVSPSGQARLHEVGSVIDQVDKELRRLSHELRPMVLDDLGLVPAVRFLADGISTKGKMQVRVNSSIERRYSARVETAAYRVIQEALTNATKHSHASYLTIQVDQERAHLCCRVRDNGVGFDSPNRESRTKDKGLGLVGIRERVSSVGGTLLIDSTPGRGTTLTFRIPIEP